MARPRKQAKVEMAETRRALIYLRVSTSEQADSGLGLEAQERRCRAHCEAQGWEVGAVYTDAGVSAKSLDRPKLQEALDALKPGDMLVVLKLDRLTRRVADLEPLADRIKKAGADWVSISEHFDSSSACGRLMLNMVLVLSQWEREVIAERTSDALQAKKARRERIGGTPLGYKVVETAEETGDGVTVRRSLEVNEEEMAAVVRARELREQGKALQAICDTLTAEGYQTKRGGKWFPANVARLIEKRYVETLA